jgi:hypothetical protein
LGAIPSRIFEKKETDFPDASQLSNFCGNAIFVAAGEACVRLRSSREIR